MDGQTAHALRPRTAVTDRAGVLCVWILIWITLQVGAGEAELSQNVVLGTRNSFRMHPTTIGSDVNAGSL